MISLQESGPDSPDPTARTRLPPKLLPFLDPAGRARWRVRLEVLPEIGMVLRIWERPLKTCKILTVVYVVCVV